MFRASLRTTQLGGAVELEVTFIAVESLEFGGKQLQECQLGSYIDRGCPLATVPICGIGVIAPPGRKVHMW